MGKNLRDEIGKNIYDNADPEQKKQAEELYGKYKNMNENQLMNELMQKVKMSKQNGTYSSAELRKMIDSIKPMLTPEQRSRIEEIFKAIT